MIGKMTTMAPATIACVLCIDDASQIVMTPGKAAGQMLAPKPANEIWKRSSASAIGTHSRGLQRIDRMPNHAATATIGSGNSSSVLGQPNQR